MRLSEEPELARATAASVKQCLAFGERVGQQVRRIGSGFGYAGERPALTSPRCASVHGFSLHANTHIPAHRRDQLERLIRYTVRGAVALDRLHEDARGDLVSTFTKPWSDGTTGLTRSPLALLEKLVALVPLPRVHLVRYGGCLAPHSLRRGAITPTPRQQGVEKPEASHAAPHGSWARLLKRVLALAMATCPFCRQGALRIIAAITQAEVIRTILRHLKLSVDPPPIAPARSRQAAFDRVASCPQRCAWSRRRRARSGGVSHTSHDLQSRLQWLKLPPQPSKTACPESSPSRTPLKPSLPPSSASCPRALGLALGRAGHAGRAIDGVWPPAGGWGARGGRAAPKGRLNFLSA